MMSLSSKEKDSYLCQMFPELNQMSVCPVTGDRFNIKTIVYFLNDEYNWPREQIADWLETLDVNLTIGENNDNHD